MLVGTEHGNTYDRTQTFTAVTYTMLAGDALADAQSQRYVMRNRRGRAAIGALHVVQGQVQWGVAHENAA